MARGAFRFHPLSKETGPLRLHPLSKARRGSGGYQYPGVGINTRCPVGLAAASTFKSAARPW
jgi:hypothetical protein